MKDISTSLQQLKYFIGLFFIEAPSNNSRATAWYLREEDAPEQYMFLLLRCIYLHVENTS